MNIYALHFDGSCPKNPGEKASYGFTIHESIELIKKDHGAVLLDGILDNHIAEFFALYRGLQAVESSLLPGSWIEVRGDDRTVMNILSKRWKAMPEKRYYPAYLKVSNYLKKLRKLGYTFQFYWIPRTMNTECDLLSRQ
jgi:ribonuclease HI